jgi:hypothetical protein
VLREGPQRDCEVHIHRFLLHARIAGLVKTFHLELFVNWNRRRAWTLV